MQDKLWWDTTATQVVVHLPQYKNVFVFSKPVHTVQMPGLPEKDTGWDILVNLRERWGGAKAGGGVRHGCHCYVLKD